MITIIGAKDFLTAFQLTRVCREFNDQGIL